MDFQSISGNGDQRDHFHQVRTFMGKNQRVLEHKDIPKTFRVQTTKQDKEAGTQISHPKCTSRPLALLRLPRVLFACSPRRKRFSDLRLRSQLAWWELLDYRS